MKKILLTFSLIALVSVLMELASWAVVRYFLEPRIAYHQRADMVFAQLPPETAFGDSEFDPVLGWRSAAWKSCKDCSASEKAAFKARDLARRNPYDSDRHLIAAYGDSFVWGEEVEDNEAFPYYLSELTKSDVENYGIPGGGPDQAVLRYAQNLEKGLVPKVAILAMPSENIARVVNIYRRCYQTQANAMLIKPKFAHVKQQWKVINPLLDGPRDTKTQSELYEAYKAFDFWCQHNEARPNFAFPYLYSIVKTFYYMAFEVKRWQDLYSDAGALETLAHSVEQFVTLSEGYGITPIFTIIPMPQDLLAIQDGRRAYYTDFLKGIAKRYDGRLAVVNVMDQSFDFNRFNVAPFAGHASAYGNQVIAETFFKALPPH